MHPLASVLMMVLVSVVEGPIFFEGPIKEQWIPPLQRAHIGQYVASIPDPNSELDIVGLAHNRSVAKELGLTLPQSEKLEKLLRDSGGLLGTPSFSFKGVNVGKKSTEESIRKSLMDRELVFQLMEEIKQENVKAISEIFSKEQLARLKQVVYHIEVARVGISEAVREGFLGLRIGIRPDQANLLGDASLRIESNCAAKIKEAMKELRSQSDLFSGLTDLKLKIEERTGEPFDFQPERWDAWNDAPISGSNYVPSIPDQQDVWAYASLACNRSVARELRLTSDDKSRLSELLETRNGLPAVDRSLVATARSQKEKWAKLLEQKKSMAKERFEEILDPQQRDRLNQLVYQIEIARVGFGEAIEKGRLGSTMVCSKSDLALLKSREKQFLSRQEEEILRIKSEALEEFLRLLEPLQLREAKSALGAHFQFRDELTPRERALAEQRQ